MPPLPFLVFVVGTGSLGAEIAAVRLLAPYFGASTIVWANTIGIVLVALSVGYWLGGRLADRHPNMRALCLVALSAAVMLAAGAVRGRPAARRGGGRARRDLRRRVRRLAARRARAGGDPGAAARDGLALGDPARASTPSRRPARWPGRLYALSTAGSLLGTLVSALVLIPLVGTRRTFLIFALAIAIVAVWGLRPVRRWALAPAAIAVLIALPVGTLKAEHRGRRPRDPRGRDRVPVRAGDRVPRRHAHARAERGPGGALGVRGGVRRRAGRPARPDVGAHRRRLGRPPRAPVRGPRRAAAARGDPRQRGGHHLARV